MKIIYESSPLEWTMKGETFLQKMCRHMLWHPDDQPCEEGQEEKQDSIANQRFSDGSRKPHIQVSVQDKSVKVKFIGS